MRHSNYEVYVTIPPDGGYSWVIALMSFFGFIITSGVSNSFFLYRDRIANHLNVSTTMAAVVGSTYSSLCLFLGPISSALCNHYGFRVVMIFGGILSATGMGFTYLSHSFGVTLVLFGIFTGVGSAFTLMSVNAPIGHWFDKRRPIALGLSSSGSGLGMLIVPYSTEMIMNNANWKYAYLFHSALFFIYIFLGIFLVPLPPIRLVMEDETPRKPGEIKQGTYTIQELPSGKLHNKYHPDAKEIMRSTAPSQLRMAPTDAWVEASSARPLGKGSNRLPAPSPMGRGPNRINERSSQIQKSSSVYAKKKLCVWCKWGEIGNRPLYKTDLFYHGNIYRLEKQEKLEMATAMDYAMSVTKLPRKKDIEEEKTKCLLYPEAIKRILYTMFDVSIMKNLAFLLFLISNFFFTMGACLPVLYINEMAKKEGDLTTDLLNWLVPAVGIGIFTGRITAGICLQLIPHIKAFHISLVVDLGIVLLTGGIIFNHNTIYYFTYASCFGIFTSIRSLIMVDYVGLDHLTSATGILFAFNGIALLIAPPFADGLKNICPDCTVYVFYSSTSLMAISLVFLCPMIFIKVKVP